MPWSNQNGGGPWGGGNRNQGPWGQGPQRPRGNGNGGPPDLEDLLRRGQERLGEILPGGANGGAVLLVGFFAVVFWLMQCIYTVQPDEKAVELSFGKPKEEISAAGLQFILWPMETVEFVKVTEQQLNVGANGSGAQNEGLMLTGDQNIVNVQFSVLYEVRDPKAYLFDVENPEKTLAQVADSVMREVVGRRPAEDIFRDNRQAIALEVKDTIQKTMELYKAGIAVNTVSIEDVSPPREVASAFDEVQRAEQDEDRMVEQANQYANQKRGQANGEAAKIREDAAAYKNRIVKEAEGEAQRFLSVYDQYAKAPDVTRQRLFIETMERVMAGSKKVILDKEGGNNVLPYLPLGDLNGRTTTTKGAN